MVYWSQIVKFLARSQALYVLGAIILFLSMSINLFGVGRPGQFYSYQKDSESLVLNTLKCSAVHGKDLFGGHMVTPKANYHDGCIAKEFQIYPSQLGLQTQVINLFAPSGASLDEYIRWVKVILVGLTTFLLLMFIRFVKHEFGSLVAWMSLLMLTLSDWLIMYARNLYWMTPLLLAPFVFSLAAYPYFVKRKKLPLFYGVFGGLIFLKATTGYEHLSSVSLAGMAPIIYYHIKQGGDLKSVVPRLAMLCGVTFVGFAAALGLHVGQTTNYYGSFDRAAREISKRVQVRTMESPQGYLLGVSRNFADNDTEVFNQLDRYFDMGRFEGGPNESFKVEVISIIHYATLPAFSLPIGVKQPLLTLLQSITVVTIITGAIVYFWHRQEYFGNVKYKALAYMGVFSLISSLSWLILAHGHTINHPHLNGIVYMLPFLPVAYIIMTVHLSNLVRNRISR